MKKMLLCLLAVVALVSYATAQDQTITGTVKSDDGVVLPGVSILVKGTTKGTSTDPDGNFTIAAPVGSRLIFSFVGFISQEYVIDKPGTTPVIITLMSDTKQLSEVVVTGVGVATSKAKLGIAVESVTSKDLPLAPTASIDQALVGKIAGAQISSTSGSPGAGVSILLRGINTINRGTNPMILIDGVQVAATDLNSIDLNTIERVEVVQGAASATIYGAQGANGVIQLFTKKGKAGQLNIDISSGISQNTYLNIGGLRKANLHGYTTNSNNEVIGGSGNPLTFDPETLSYSENLQWLSTDPKTLTNKAFDKNLKYYDHYSLFFIPAYTINNSVSVSGGKEKLDFLFSLSNNKQGSNIVNNGDLSRTNFTSRVGLDIAKNLKFATTTQLVYTKNTLKSYDRNIIYSVNNARPFANFEQKDLDGNYGLYFGDAVGVNHWNPLYYQQYQNYNGNKIDVIQNFNLNYKPIKFLELDAKYGLNYQREENVYEIPNQTQNKNSVYQQSYLSSYVDGNEGELDNNSYNKTFQNLLASAIFRTDFQEDFGLHIPITTSTQVSFDWRNQKNKDYITYGYGLPTYTPYKANQATTYRVQTDYVTPFVTYGYLVNQRIEYGEIAGLSGGFRTDYSSAFGRGSKPFTFPRGDAYFRISSLEFWKNSSVAKILPEFKIRAAYGQAGIQPQAFNRYVTLGTRTIGNTNAFYYTPDQSNPDLNVEVSKETEIGTDLNFDVLPNTNWLNNIGISVSYWKRSTDNAIYKVDVAPSTGAGTLLTNAFSLGSRGLQASINAAIYHDKDITWNFTTNFGKQTSEITSLNGAAQVVVTSSAGSTNYVLKAGEKIGQLYGFVSIHSLDALKPDGTPFIPEAQRANYTVASNGYVVNKTTKAPFFSADQYSFGDPNPKFNMSFINDITFRNYLNFSFQFDWLNGSHLYNQTKEWMYRDGIHSDYEKVFTMNAIEDGTEKTVSGAYSAFYRGVYAERSRNGTKDYFYENASFLRLRNVSIGLDFAKLFKIPATKKLQLVLTGRNILTFTKYTGMDPEISSGNNTGNSNSAFDRGVDHNTMPNYKSYQATLNIGF